MQQQLIQMLHEAAESDLFATIVNAPFQFQVDAALMFLGIIVLLLADSKSKQIYRVALTNNDMAEAAKKVSVKKFQDIVIPTNSRKNLIAQVIRNGRPAMTTDWKDLFIPSLTPAQSRINQANAGIASSAVYPLTGMDCGGALIFSYYQYIDKISAKTKKFMESYVQGVSDELSKHPALCESYLVNLELAPGNLRRPKK
ncbi:MAG TPA: hypothetical protein VLG47_02570 [Candidatus Saccharimonadales bacterium]|nr:hypothetical protein [Candidatus Saccharimonadales bacterium]